MIDEKKMIKEIQKLYIENDKCIKDCEKTENDATYYLCKNVVYIEVNNIIKDLLEIK